ANALTLGAVCGLALALSRILPMNTSCPPGPPQAGGVQCVPSGKHGQNPPGPPQAGGVRPFSPASEGSAPDSPRVRGVRGVQMASIVLAILLTVHALRIAGGRLEAYNAAEALAAGTGAVALEGYRSAIALDGGNVEYRLQLAAILAASNQLEKAREVLDNAVKVAPIGKVYYRYGKLLSRMGKPEEALRMHEQVRELEPNNLQNLLALADVYKAASKSEEAARIYRRMVSLYHSPVGQVRPVPELVDWEYGMAFLGLAEQALARGDRAAAEPDLREGAGILGRFWETRTQGVAQLRVNPEVRRNTVLRYDWALEQWAKALREIGRTEEAAKIEERRARLHAEMEKETGNLPP
ncbi:MAG TPA: tetratricopeptide repeat protein, partial [Chthonomonadales bacterium]|nr:tetratricopeptide repeat protein [Chthonomonadales bacterium]